MKFVKPARRVEKVFLHCSDSDYKIHDDISIIRKWHVEENKWSDVGYHFFIKKDGTIQEGRKLDRIPAAQVGHNTGSIAICLSGKIDFTQKQFKSLFNLCLQIDTAYKSAITFHGHKEVAPGRSCPNFDYQKVLNLKNGKIIK
jgi:N-acetylmuramoyl-L-alanine amidase